MLKILMLNYEFPPLGGGGANTTYYLLKEFSRFKEVEVDLVTSSVDKFRIEKFSENIIIHYLDINKRNKGLHYQTIRDVLAYSWKSYGYSKALMRKKKYDLCHAFFGIPCGYIAMKLGLPYIISLLGSDVPGHNPKFKRVYFFLGPTIRKAWHQAKVIVANSQDLRKEAIDFYPIKAEEFPVIPNGVDCEKFKPQNRTDKIFRVLYVGRFHQIKGIKYLLESFEEFMKQGSNLELVMVGEGELFDSVRQKYKDFTNIKLLGRKSQGELVKIYQQSDVLVLPSLNEGMSNVVLEAMASGLAIILTDTGDAGELVGKDCGIIVQRKNSKDILDALQILYNNPTLLGQIRRASRRKAGAMGWKKVANSYLTLYRDVSF